MKSILPLVLANATFAPLALAAPATLADHATLDGDTYVKGKDGALCLFKKTEANATQMGKRPCEDTEFPGGLKATAAKEIKKGDGVTALDNGVAIVEPKKLTKEKPIKCKTGTYAPVEDMQMFKGVIYDAAKFKAHAEVKAYGELTAVASADYTWKDEDNDIGDAKKCKAEDDATADADPNCGKDWFACGVWYYTTLSYTLILGVIGGIVFVVMGGGDGDDDKDSDE